MGVQASLCSEGCVTHLYWLIRMFLYDALENSAWPVEAITCQNVSYLMTPSVIF